MGKRSYEKSRGASDQLREKIVNSGITYVDLIRAGAQHPEIVSEAWPHAPSFSSSIRRFLDGGGLVTRNRDAIEKLIAPWFEPDPQPQVSVDDIKEVVREAMYEILNGHHLEFVGNETNHGWRADLLRRSTEGASSEGSSVDQVIENLGIRQTAA